jgi:hypothetical protein
MISYSVYKIIHYVGIFTVVASLGAFLARVAVVDHGPGQKDPWRRNLVIGHGTGLFLILLGGFGMLARLDVTSGLSLPGWIWAKLVLWVALGAMVTIGKRAPNLAAALAVLAPILAMLAGITAHTKPF